MIRLEAVEKIYKGSKKHADVTALAATSLDIKQGEIFGIIGKSGAGKSTLLRTLNLLERPSSGRILLNGEDVTALGNRSLPAFRRRIGMVFQQFNLLSTRTVFDNVALPLELTRTPKAEIKKRVSEILAFVGLEERADHYPAQLSGGQKQRVGIARALVVEPEVLLCDEITSALDPETTQQILDLLQGISKRLNLTTVVITHEMSVVKQVCDRVAVMDGGHVVELGHVFDIFAHPQHPTTRAMVEGDGENILPEAITVRLQSEPAAERNALLKLTFADNTAHSPVISQLGRSIDADINVIAGRIDYIAGKPLGILFVEIIGGPDKTSAATAFLNSNNQPHEVIGHVPATH